MNREKGKPTVSLLSHTWSSAGTSLQSVRPVFEFPCSSVPGWRLWVLSANFQSLGFLTGDNNDGNCAYLTGLF